MRNWKKLLAGILVAGIVTQVSPQVALQTVEARTPMSYSLGTWTGSGEMSTVIGQDVEDFLKLDDENGIVDESNYEVVGTDGTTTITLKEEYLKSLNLQPGSYHWGIYFSSNGRATYEIGYPPLMGEKNTITIDRSGKEQLVGITYDDVEVDKSNYTVCASEDCFEIVFDEAYLQSISGIASTKGFMVQMSDDIMMFLKMEIDGEGNIASGEATEPIESKKPTGGEVSKPGYDVTHGAVVTESAVEVPDWGYKREYRIYDVKDIVWDPWWPTGSLGDWDGNGKVELNDAKEALRAALLLDDSDEAKCFRVRISEDHEGVTLEDVRQVLKAALLLPNYNSEIRYVDHTAMYQSIEFKRLEKPIINQVFTSKASLKNYVEKNLDNEELNAYIESLPDDWFGYNSLLLNARPVYATSLDAVGVKDVHMKEDEKSRGILVKFEDQEEHVIASANQYYIELTMTNVCLSSHKAKETYYVDVDTKGGTTAQLTSYETDLKLPTGTSVIRSTDDLMTLKNGWADVIKENGRYYPAEYPNGEEGDRIEDLDKLFNVLPQEVSGYEEYAYVIHVSEEGNDFDTTDLSFVKEDGEVSFSIEKGRYLKHQIKLQGKKQCIDVIRIEKSILEDCQVEVGLNVAEKYVDFAPIQQRFELNLNRELGLKSDPLFIRCEEDKSKVIDIMKRYYYNENNEDYGDLISILQNADMNKQDIYIDFAGNSGDTCAVILEGEGVLEPCVYVTKHPNRIETCYNCGEEGLEPETQMVTVLYMKKGIIGKQISAAECLLSWTQLTD